jgi:hypothetical protein
MTRRQAWALLGIVAVALGSARPAAAAAAHADTCLNEDDDHVGYKWERSGTHDAANIRTIFWNFGMVGDYPRDPGGVDLSTFHSAEVPKGTGMNYTDGITPFVLAKVKSTDGLDQYIMETGYRERQAISGSHPGELQMRFEPRRGFFQEKTNINTAKSPAISIDRGTWPPTWPDKMADSADVGWAGSWDGYFGKRPAADQESFFVMDDNYYDSFDFFPDSLCPDRFGLGLRVDVRGFQWANPQAGNVIFWHYDITNEGTTNYHDNIIFGLYMDSGVGGSAKSCDGVFESDDDNAFFDKSFGLNLVYTWDKAGHGVDLAGTCSPTGYLGYAYLETPGNSTDGIDNDGDGIIDEKRDSGPGERILGQDNIRAYLLAHPEKYDLAQFEQNYGPLENRSAYRVDVWWTGDEDLDWVQEFDDTGADGVLGSRNPKADGEGDGIPTEGEPHFDRTDVDESDQIGLTGFKMNRIAAGLGGDPNQVDDIVFFTNQYHWPQRLFEMFSSSDSTARFDNALVQNYNIAFLFASGPFRLPPDAHERFSLALAFGADLAELRENVHVVQQIYNANYQFATPPPRPTLTGEPGDGYVKLAWDDVAEHAFDPVTGLNDFEGYRIYRATDPEFRDARVLTSGRGNEFPGNGKPMAQFDVIDDLRSYSRTSVEGLQYWLGSETGITHAWTDTSVTNGQLYYYAVTAYDYGSPPSVPDSLAFFPSENSIPVSRTLRGGVILPSNADSLRPNPRAPGYIRASVDTATRITGHDDGSVAVQVVSADHVSGGHLFKVAFLAPSDSIHALSYALIDSTLSARKAALTLAGLPRDSLDAAIVDTLFRQGTDFEGKGIGPVGAGLLPVVSTPDEVLADMAHSGFRIGSNTTDTLVAIYRGNKSKNLRRPGFPEDLRIVFYDTVADTSQRIPPYIKLQPTKFRVFAKTDTGYRQIDFVFSDSVSTFTTWDKKTIVTPLDSTLSNFKDVLLALDYSHPTPQTTDATWRVLVVNPFPIVGKPAAGDTFDLKLVVPFGPTDAFVFNSHGSRVDPARAQIDFRQNPYVVPNPYVGSASFEPSLFAVTGRGDRRLEFRGIPQGGTIRIYTVHGDLVQTLQQDGSDKGYVAWNLRTKDNLDVAPGLYIFHVTSRGVGTYVGKFAVIK